MTVWRNLNKLGNWKAVAGPADAGTTRSSAAKASPKKSVFPSGGVLADHIHRTSVAASGCRDLRSLNRRCGP